MAGFADASRLSERPDSGELTGKRYHIACKTWFTSTGGMLPLSFKFEGDDGVLQTVGRVRVCYEESKNYSGIPSKEYGCEAVIGGFLRQFRLIFYCESCQWIMLI